MRMRAVICEDHSQLRSMLEVIFKRRGYEVFTYSDARRCPLSILPRCPCPAKTLCADVILSDVQMPGLSGIDFIAELISKCCRCPHLGLMSGRWSPNERTRAASLGCMLFDKPFSIHQLISWLERVERTIPRERRLFELDWQPVKGRNPPQTRR